MDSAMGQIGLPHSTEHISSLHVKLKYGVAKVATSRHLATIRFGINTSIVNISSYGCPME